MSKHFRQNSKEFYLKCFEALPIWCQGTLVYLSLYNQSGSLNIKKNFSEAPTHVGF